MFQNMKPRNPSRMPVNNIHRRSEPLETLLVNCNANVSARLISFCQYSCYRKNKQETQERNRRKICIPSEFIWFGVDIDWWPLPVVSNIYPTTPASNWLIKILMEREREEGRERKLFWGLYGLLFWFIERSPRFLLGPSLILTNLPSSFRKNCNKPKNITCERPSQRVE